MTSKLKVHIPSFFTEFIEMGINFAFVNILGKGMEGESE